MINGRLIKERKIILEELGGLPPPVIKNKEWLYILEEETRNSILIEGFFLSEKELKKILKTNNPVSRDEEEALNYYKTANFIYGLGYENYKQNEFLFGIPLIRQINKELGYTGEFRKGEIKIAGAKFNPPKNYIEEWVSIFVDFVKYLEKNFDFNGLAVSHGFFEEIHPFDDGNGRTGRIILNYILVSKGYPPVILKGDEENKKKYYKALEEMDYCMKEIFLRKPDKNEVIQKLKDIKISQLTELILESLKENLDKIILGIYERNGFKLEPVSELLKTLGYSPSSTRQLIKRGKIIAVKKENKWYSVRQIFDKLL